MRRYRMVPNRVRGLTGDNSGLADLDGWFESRTGAPMPAAARLFATGPDTRPAKVETLVVLRFPSAEITDGVCQWPVTADRVADRLGPTTVAVDAEEVTQLVADLTQLGIAVEGISS